MNEDKIKVDSDEDGTVRTTRVLYDLKVRSNPHLATNGAGNRKTLWEKNADLTVYLEQEAVISMGPARDRDEKIWRSIQA